MIKVIFTDDQDHNGGPPFSRYLLDQYIVKISKENGSTATILCLTDFSESSQVAMKWAVEMAKRLGLHLTIIYPYRLDLAGRRDDVVQAKKNQDLKATAEFDSMAREILRDEEIKYDFFSEVGFIHDRIEEHAKKKNIAFAVIQKDFAISKKDTFQELIEKIQVPLVIIPGK